MTNRAQAALEILTQELNKIAPPAKRKSIAYTIVQACPSTEHKAARAIARELYEDSHISREDCIYLLENFPDPTDPINRP